MKITLSSLPFHQLMIFVGEFKNQACFELEHDYSKVESSEVKYHAMVQH